MDPGKDIDEVLLLLISTSCHMEVVRNFIKKKGHMHSFVNSEPSLVSRRSPLSIRIY